MIPFQSVSDRFRPSGGHQNAWNADSRYSRDNGWQKWSATWHADVSWSIAELFNFWPRSDDFHICGTFFTWVKCVGSGNFLENAWRGQPEKGERRRIFDSLYLVLSGLSLVLWHRWELCYHRRHRDRRAFAIGEGNDSPLKAPITSR